MNLTWVPFKKPSNLWKVEQTFFYRLGDLSFSVKQNTHGTQSCLCAYPLR